MSKVNGVYTKVVMREKVVVRMSFENNYLLKK